MSGACGCNNVVTGEKGKRALNIAIAIGLTYMTIEVIGGIVSGSLSLLADAGHMFSDVVGLLMARIAIYLSQEVKTENTTFGFKRIEIIAAFTNAVIVIVVAFNILFKAVLRWIEPIPIKTDIMFSVGLGGLIVNILMISFLWSVKDESLNIKGAWLHVLSDLVGSIQVMIAAVVYYLWGFVKADAIAAGLIALLLFQSSIRLMIKSARILLESAPAGLQVSKVKRAVENMEGVEEVHDLHLWTIKEGFDSLTAHVVVSEHYKGSRDTLVDSLRKMLLDKFGLSHVTIQLEPPNGFEDCVKCGENSETIQKNKDEG